ncbi:unnamed protein product [Linum trigynum]|uniref:Uncharacterized protein n=1 Tax=Linum trigynum TaxID=586398 RepID=A0AAV2G7E3_9ROSI
MYIERESKVPGKEPKTFCYGRRTKGLKGAPNLQIFLQVRGRRTERMGDESSEIRRWENGDLTNEGAGVRTKGLKGAPNLQIFLQVRGRRTERMGNESSEIRRWENGDLTNEGAGVRQTATTPSWGAT